MNEILKKKIEQIPYRKIHPYKTDVNDAYNQGFEDGAEFALKSQWISIDEALPEDNQYVVAMLHDKTIFVGKCIVWKGEARWYFETPYGLYSDIELYSDEVIAWMPIPEMEE